MREINKFQCLIQTHEYLPSPLLSPAANIVLYSIFDTRTETSGGALEDIGPGPSDEEKADTDNGLSGAGNEAGRDNDRTANSATGG